MHRSLVYFLVLPWTLPAWADGTAAGYQVQTVAGSCPVSSGPATSGQLGTSNGVAVDASGNIYFSDTDNHLVRKIDASGTISTLAGTCTAGYSGDSGPAVTAQLNQPYGLAVDSGGNVYVADYGNNRVRRIGTNGIITTIAGNGQAGQAGDGALAVNAQLVGPRNVALDASGNLYISEYLGNQVRVVSPDSKISIFAGIGIAGNAGDKGLATAAQLNSPAGLAVDRTGALYIADFGNQCIRKVQGGRIDTVSVVNYPSGNPDVPNKIPLAGVVGLAVDAGGVIYVASESGSGLYNPATSVWASVGPPGPTSDVTVDASGNLYIAAGTQIWKQSGSVLEVAAGGGGIGDGGIATAAQLNGPSAVALDAAGNFHIADSLHGRIRTVNNAGQIVTLAGTGIVGCAGDGGPAALAQLGHPEGVTVDNLNNVVIADTGCNKIRRVGADGRISTVVGCQGATGLSCQGLGQEGLPAAQMPLNGPQGVCADSAGVLYVADSVNNRVLRLAPGGGVTTAAGNGSQGYSGDGYLAQLAQLFLPTNCTVDSAGDLLIADTGNHAIRKVTPDGNISTVAGAGVQGFSGDGGAATSALLSLPQGVAADGDGNIYISDTGNSRIRKVTLDGVIRTIAAGDSAVPINSPRGSALDGSGSLYFADTVSNRVRKLVPGTATTSGPAGSPPAQPVPLSAVNAASLQTGPVAPGELISILGLGLGPQVGVSGTPDATGLLPTAAGGTEVDFDGNAAPVLYTQASQVNVQVPYSLAGAANTNVVVLYNGQQAGTLVLPVVSAAPALFSAVVNQDGSANSQTQPAPQNSIITLYATGAGLMNGSNIAGQPAAAPYAQPAGSVSLTVAAMPAEILFAGSAPGLVGMLQINARTPGGFVPSGQTTVVLTVGGASSPPLTMWIQ